MKKHLVFKNLHSVYKFTSVIILILYVFSSIQILAEASELVVSQPSIEKECMDPNNAKTDICKKLAIKKEQEEKLRGLEIAEKQRNLNNSTSACDDAQEKLDTLSEKCPGLDLEVCFEAARTCKDGGVPDLGVSSSTSSSVMSAITPLLGGLMGGNMSSMMGGGMSSQPDPCKTTKDTWDQFMEKRQQYVDSMNDNKSNMEETLTNVQDQISQLQEDQASAMNDLAAKVQEFESQKSSSRYAKVKRQLELNKDVRELTLKIKETNANINLAQQELNRKINAQAALRPDVFVSPDGSKTTCASFATERKSGAKLAMEQKIAEAQQKLIDTQKTNNITDMKELQDLKKQIEKSINNQENELSKQIQEQYKQCVNAAKDNYIDAFQNASREIESLRSQIEQSLNQVQAMQGELNDLYTSFQNDLIAANDAIEIGDKAGKNFMTSMQQNVMSKSALIAQAQQRMNSLNQQLVTQGMMTQAAQNSLSQSLGINSIMGFSLGGINSNSQVPFVGVADAVAYIKQYDTLTKRIAKVCDKKDMDSEYDTSSSK